MRNIYKEIDELTEQYAGVELSEKQLEIYDLGKRYYWVAYFLLFFVVYGIHRFYMRDKFSIRYGIFLLLNGLLFIALFPHREIFLYSNGLLHYLWGMFLMFLIAVFTAEFWVILPIIKRNNLLLKKQIIEDIESVKIRFPSACWIYVAIAILVLKAIGFFVKYWDVYSEYYSNMF